jgi:hypothetical protein
VESIVVYAVPEHLRVNAGTASPSVLQLLNDERSATFAHDKSIAQRIEWTTSQNRVTRPPAHRFYDVERANGNGRQRRLRPARNDYVRKIVANVTQRFADRDCATGATV